MALRLLPTGRARWKACQPANPPPPDADAFGLGPSRLCSVSNESQKLKNEVLERLLQYKEAQVHALELQKQASAAACSCAGWWGGTRLYSRWYRTDTSAWPRCRCPVLGPVPPFPSNQLPAHRRSPHALAAATDGPAASLCGLC